MNERGLPAIDRVVRLLDELGIERAHVVQGVAEAAAHPEMVASLALVTPAASASGPVHQLAGSRMLVTPFVNARLRQRSRVESEIEGDAVRQV